MFVLRKRDDYIDPCTTVTQVDIEGIICASVEFNVEAKELQNYAIIEGEEAGTDSWLE